MSNPCSPLTSLSEEHQLMGQLLEVIEREQRHLVAAEIEALNQVTAEKSQLVGRLALLAGERHSALGAAACTPDERGMESWLASQRDDVALTLWGALLERTRLAKELNRVNGMLVNRHLAHTQGALNAMHPQPQGGNFYGPSGQTTSGAASRRVVIG
ncbi:MAG: flagellar protein FlgN [Pseudomonadota bacterium]